MLDTLSSTNDKITNYENLNEFLPTLNCDFEFLAIENCPSLASAFDTCLILIRKFLYNSSSTLGIFIKFHGPSDYFSDQQFFQIHEALRNFTNSFLFAYETSDGKNGCVYWRLTGYEQIFYCIISNNEANLVEFVVKYLMTALKDERHGKNYFKLI